VKRAESLRATILDKLDKLARLYWASKVKWTPRRIWLRLEDISIDRPVFFVGTQGGGLTLVSRVLARHRDVVTVRGNYRNWAAGVEMHCAFTDLPDAFALRSPGFWTYRHYRFGPDQDHPQFGRGRSWVYATNALLGQYRKTAADYTPELAQVLQDTIRKCIRAYAVDVATARFVDKSQSYSLKVPLLKRCLPDAQFVVVIRNPYTVV